jgi:hypothetical protein
MTGARDIVQREEVAAVVGFVRGADGPRYRARFTSER